MAVYLDHNAGSPLRPEVRQALGRFSEELRGNPASVHRSGQRVRRELERARQRLAALIGASPSQVVFTSGGTESNNLALLGAVGMRPGRKRIITSAVEHSSILAPLRELEQAGYEVVRIAPDHDGRIALEPVRRALDAQVALVTLGLANNEVGTIQELQPLAEPIAAAGAIFHIDAAQALGRIPVDVASLGCDLMTLSGHKLGAPAGIGALYVRERTALRPVILGGPQEFGMRGGTPNVMGAVGFGVAAQVLSESLLSESSRITSLCEMLFEGLRSAIRGLRLNGPLKGRLPNTLNLTFPDVLGESMLIALDLEGIEVSMGSACAAGAVEPSHVLLAMGRTLDEARSSLRLSLGWSTTAAEIERAVAIIARIWRRVRGAEPLACQRDAGVAR